MKDGLTTFQREAIREVLAEFPQVERAVLFGSRAMGTWSPASDVDLALFGDSLTLEDEARIAARMEDLGLPVTVDLVRHATIQNDALREHISRYGKAIYKNREHIPKTDAEAADEQGSGAKGEWRVLSLRQAGVELLDCEHRTPPASDDGFPYIAIPQVKDGRLNLDGVRRITRQNFEEWTRKTQPQAYDVILSRRCNPGETAFVPPKLECALGQNLVLLRANGQRVVPEYLRWLVRGPEWWEQIGTFLNVGAVFDSLKCADIPNFRLTIPPIADQNAIADVLGTLDDKIELNRKMNETLEAMARAIFQSWFVNFDPVHAKARGEQPAGMSDDVAALFPSEFDDSELGPIPKGWRVGRLDDVAVLQRGFDLPSSTRTPGPYPVVAASGPSGTHDKWMVRGPGVTTGRSGVLGNVFYVHEDFWPLNTSLWVKEFKNSTPAYAYYLLRRVDFRRFNAGSAVPTLNRNHVHWLPTLMPPSDLIAQFEALASAMLMRQHAIDLESETLAALRDTLLPRLISGHLRVPDAERPVRDAIE